MLKLKRPAKAGARKGGKVVKRKGLSVFISGRKGEPSSDQWTAMALAKKLTIPIPARPYIRPAFVESYSAIMKIMDLQK